MPLPPLTNPRNSSRSSPSTTDQTDRTGEIMLEMQREYENVRAIIFPQNLGKREGMATGIIEGKGEVIVFIDSDSRVARSAIRQVVQYFAYPEVGAVSGIVDVDNKTANILTKMQTVRYFVAFDVCQGSRGSFRRSDLLLRSLFRLPSPRLLNKCSRSGWHRVSWERRARMATTAHSRITS